MHIDLGIGGAEKLMVTAAVALLKVHVINSVKRIFLNNSNQLFFL